jgi:hypothetical protein
METQVKQAKKRILIREAEFSAIGWVISLALHLLLIGSLMLLTFSQFLAKGSDGDEQFTVELTELEGGSGQTLEVVPTTMSNSSGSDSTEISVINTPMSNQAIVLSEVENSEVNITLENVELTASLTASGAFNESLSGSDTSGAAGFFGLTASGTSFAYVIDHSGSMEGESLATAVRELCRSVRSLNEDVKFYLIFYNDNFLPMKSSALVDATSGNKSKYLSWAESVTASGGTDPTDAVKYAISLKPDVIWLLSDGEFDPAAVTVIKEANTRKVKINTLAFGAGAGQAQLQAIASQNNGKFRFVPF